LDYVHFSWRQDCDHASTENDAAKLIVGSEVLSIHGRFLTSKDFRFFL